MTNLQGGSWFSVRYAAAKVPQIALAFWIIKVLTTGMGETLSDLLVHRYGGPTAVIPCAFAFVAVLLWQISLRHFSTWVYWLAVVMVSIFGTMAADVTHIVLHVPYAVSTAAFSIALVIIFVTWHQVDSTLSIHSVITRRRELFYWAAVLGTFALGTAAGDMTARTLGLGYAGSTVLFAALMVIPAAFWLVTRRHEVLWFWTAYVLTRPLGASFADYLGLPHSRGGLGWGVGLVTLLWSAAIVVAVAWLALTHRDEPTSDVAI